MRMLIKNAEIIFSGSSGEQNFSKRNIFSEKRMNFDWLPENCQGIYQEDFKDGYKLYFNFENPSGVALLNKEAQNILGLVDGKRNIKEIFAILSAQEGKEIKIENLADFFYLRNFFYTLDRLGLVSIPELKKDQHNYSPSSLSVWLSVTNQCNLACEYCYVDKSKSALSEEMGKKAIDKIFTTALKHKFREVIIKFSGGEPLLELPLVFKLADYALQKSVETRVRVRFLLLSNGTLIKSAAVGGLKKRNIRVIISLDGIGQWHDKQAKYRDGRGSFQEVAKTIDLLIAKDFPPSIIGLVSALNLKGLPELVNYLIKKKLRATFNFIRTTSLAGKEIIPENNDLIKKMKEVYAIIKKNLPSYRLADGLTNRTPHLDSKNFFSCGIGRNYIVVDSNGDILPCQMCLGNKGEKLGNLGQTDDLLEITQKAASMNPPVDEKNTCRDCLYRYVCQGCPIFSKTFFGSFEEKSPYCQAYKALIPEVIRIEGERLWRYEKVIKNAIVSNKPTEIRAMVNQARGRLHIKGQRPNYFLSGTVIIQQDSAPLRRGSINIITDTHERYIYQKKSSQSLGRRILDKLLPYYPDNLKIYLKLPAERHNNRKASSKSLLLRVLDKLLRYYPHNLKIYLKSPATEAEILTLQELRKKVAENEEYYKKAPYTMVVDGFG